MCLDDGLARVIYLLCRSSDSNKHEYFQIRKFTKINKNTHFSLQIERLLKQK